MFFDQNQKMETFVKMSCMYVDFQARIKKIMQSDEEVGKVAAPVPVIISRALELFVEALLKKANDITSDRGARTLTPSHL